MSLSPGPPDAGDGVMCLPVCSVLGVSPGSLEDDPVRAVAPEAGGAATAVAKELEGPSVKRGREAQEVSVVTPLPVGSGPSLEPLCLEQWLPHRSEGKGVSKALKNLLGAEYAETTDRSEEDSRRPVSTSVSWDPSKSSMERGWPCLHSDARCPGAPVFEKHCGTAEEAGSGSSVGRQNKDLLLWKDQGRPGVLLARVANSCWCPSSRIVLLGPRRGLSSRGCCSLPGGRLGAVQLEEGME